MSDTDESPAPPPSRSPGGIFPATHASAVCGLASDREEVRELALQSLAVAYWKPVYKLIRLHGRVPPPDAEDLTQAFFTRALEKDYFAAYDPGRGRFRTFLRTCVLRFIANEGKAATRLKRGGAVEWVPIDVAGAEEEILASGAEARRAPEEAFDADWVRSLLGLAVQALRGECVARGRGTHFRIFEMYDLLPEGGERPTYERIAADLGLTAGLVTNHLAWTRREFRRHLLETLRSLTGSDEEFRLEARLLLGVARAPEASTGSAAGEPG